MWLSKSLHMQADKEAKEHSRLKDNFHLVFSSVHSLCSCLQKPVTWNVMSRYSLEKSSSTGIFSRLSGWGWSKCCLRCGVVQINKSKTLHQHPFFVRCFSLCESHSRKTTKISSLGGNKPSNIIRLFIYFFLFYLVGEVWRERCCFARSLARSPLFLAQKQGCWVL